MSELIMKVESRVLYISIIGALSFMIIFLFFRMDRQVKRSFEYGVEKGKLIKLEEFKEMYMPAAPQQYPPTG
jgi:uncharacterized membrane protein YgaE (UPF0421/DUF939 family)